MGKAIPNSPTETSTLIGETSGLMGQERQNSIASNTDPTFYFLDQRQHSMASVSGSGSCYTFLLGDGWK